MSSDSTPGSSGGSSPDKKLRRPHASTQERLRNGEFDQNSNNPPVMKSKLSVDAPEFVPKFSVASQQPTDDVLYQDFQRLVSIRPSHLSGVTTAGTSGKDSAADMFKDAVFQLTSNPAPMEEFLKPVVDTLKRGVTDMAVINDIIDTLFEQSISEVNFRFTGAKICKYLSHELRQHHVFSNFRGMYLNRCKQEFDKREELLKHNVDRLCGLSMYFGELFLVLEIESDGIHIKIGLLRGAISDLIRTLLSQVDDTTLKCATQLIKLTGQALMETTNMPGNFDDSFEKIKSLEKHPSLNRTSHCLVNSVLSRLECNFGVGELPSPQKPTSQSNSYVSPTFQLNEPIFYNTQGQPITREEAGFAADDSDFEGLNREEQEMYLQWEAENYAKQQQFGDQGADNYGGQQPYIDQGDIYPPQPWSSGESSSEYTHWSSNSDQGYYSNDGPDYNNEFSSEMDDEMAAAYEIFLRESQQQ